MDGSVYFYRINGDSIGSRYQDGYASVWIRIASDFGRFLSGRGIADEYGDLIAFHLCFGLLFLAKQELARKGISGAAKALSEYGDDPLVRRMARRMVRGGYVGQVKSGVWREALWSMSLLCGLRAYVPLVLGIWSLQKFKVDEKFVSSKYGP